MISVTMRTAGMNKALAILLVLSGGCAATSARPHAPTQPQTVNAAYCRQLMADQAALASRTAEMAPRTPPTAALDNSYSEARRQCEGLARQTPNGFSQP